MVRTGDVIQRHDVRILHVPEPDAPDYVLSFLPRPDLRTLTERATKWAASQTKLWPTDLEFHRVGVADPRVYLRSHIACMPMSWSEYMVMSKKVSREIIPHREHVRILATSCLVTTRDDHFVMSQRSKNVSHYRDMLHVSAAGYVELESAQATASATPHMWKELREELALDVGDITHLSQRGLCMHLGADSAVLEVCFAAMTSLTAQEVMARSANAADSWEGKVVLLTRAEAVNVLENGPKMNPAGAATLALSL